MAATLADAYKLFHKGYLTLARMSHNGMRIDIEYLNRTKKDIDEQITTLLGELRNDPIYTTWRKRFGAQSKLGNREQLGVVIFGEMGYKSRYKTATGRDKADVGAFKDIKLPFLEKYFKIEKLRKLSGTYLTGIQREVVNGYIHANFKLHSVITYRSSVSEPNLQNIPTRDKTIAGYVRPCFIPRKGRRLVEMDFSGVEVRVAACVTNDSALVRYVTDPTTDMHRDTASDIYCLPIEFLKTHKDWAKKTVRDWSKNRFVFPEFYGSVWFQCAPDLWEGVEVGTKLPSGQTLRDHLKSKGIKRACGCKIKKDNEKEIHEDPTPDSFCYHVQKSEQVFWHQRFPEYTEWKKKWYYKFLETGELTMVTGFKAGGNLRRNEILNLPIQGPAFHCLLASANEIQRRLDKEKMKSLLINEIHDSLIADVPDEEVQEYLSISHEVMTRWLRKQWDWLTVPLEVEAEVTPVDASWYEKKEWTKDGKSWSKKE